MVVADTGRMLRMSRSELERLFTESPAGTLPQGWGRGTVIFAPGTVVAGPVAVLARLLAWQGKVFDRAGGELRNLVSPLGIRLVRAEVYREPSVFDQRDCIVLDYSKTSRVARWIRDEIREVSPGVYLGLVYWSGRMVLKFALVFTSNRDLDGRALPPAQGA